MRKREEIERDTDEGASEEVGFVRHRDKMEERRRGESGLAGRQRVDVRGERIGGEDDTSTSLTTGRAKVWAFVVPV